MGSPAGGSQVVSHMSLTVAPLVLNTSGKAILASVRTVESTSPLESVPVRAAPTADLGHPGGIQAALDDEGQPLQRRFGIHRP